MKVSKEEAILNVLEGVPFPHWYKAFPAVGEPDSPFEAYTARKSNAPTREEILADIRRLFSEVM